MEEQPQQKINLGPDAFTVDPTGSIVVVNSSELAAAVREHVRQEQQPEPEKVSGTISVTVEF